MSERIEQEVRELVGKYLWADTIRWVIDGITTTNPTDPHLGRLHEIAEVIGRRRVEVIWAEVRNECRGQIAAMVRNIVPTELIEDWLLESEVMPAMQLFEPPSYEWPDPLDSPTPSTQSVEIVYDNPEEEIQHALRRVMLKRPGVGEWTAQSAGS